MSTDLEQQTFPIDTPERIGKIKENSTSFLIRNQFLLDLFGEKQKCVCAAAISEIGELMWIEICCSMMANTREVINSNLFPMIDVIATVL